MFYHLLEATFACLRLYYDKRHLRRIEYLLEAKLCADNLDSNLFANVVQRMLQRALATLYSFDHAADYSPIASIPAPMADIARSRPTVEDETLVAWYAPQRPDAVVEKIARPAHILIEQRCYLIHAALIHGNYFIDTSATVRCLIAGFCYFVLSYVAERVVVSLQQFSQKMMLAVISPRQMMLLVKGLQVEIALLECVVS